MTIAAGFVTRDGVVMCTDSQLTGYDKSYKEKIFCQHIGAMAVAFAATGDDDHVRSLVYDCYETLHGIPIERQTVASVRKAIKRIVVNNSRQYQGEKPELLAAIGGAEGTSLFSVTNQGMPRVTLFDCRGSGSIFARHLMNSHNSMRLHAMNANQAITLGIYLVSAAKRTDASCGGGTQFLVMRGASSCQFGSHSYDNFAEQVDTFDRLTQDLFLSMGDIRMPDADFAAHLDLFSRWATKIRSELVTPGSWLRAFVESLGSQNSPRPHDDAAI